MPTLSWFARRWLLIPILSACTPARAPTPASTAPPAVATAAVPATASEPELVSNAQSHDGTPCGELGCRAFTTPEAAFAAVLAQEPLVLALGEAHAQKGTEAIASSTHRFAEMLLPLLKDKASAIVLEVWVATGGCGQVEQKVATQQKPVTESHATSNQQEFLLLGRRAKALGVEPRALVPSCEQYEKIAGAGGADIDEMLRMIARATLGEVRALLERREPVDGRMIVAYGGALHNDVAPRPGREEWSFGPELVAQTGGRYVELDLIVPEYVKDNEVWQALPWYRHFDRERHGELTLLFNPSPNSYVLIFPKTPAPSSAEGVH
jgi:hypothetical protein